MPARRTPAAWAALRAAYEAPSPETLEALSRRFGVSAKTVRRRARLEGWQRRGGEGTAHPSAPESGAGPAEPANLAARLAVAAERLVASYEERPHDGDTAEADARLLGVLAQTIQRVAALDGPRKESRDDREAPVGEGAAEVHRAELVRRLSRLADEEGA